MKVIPDRKFLQIEMISTDENNLWQEVFANRDDLY